MNPQGSYVYTQKKNRQLCSCEFQGPAKRTNQDPWQTGITMLTIQQNGTSQGENQRRFLDAIRCGKRPGPPNRKLLYFLIFFLFSFPSEFSLLPFS
jgi:hypothetical protein